jgi:hypothetical protein
MLPKKSNHKGAEFENAEIKKKKKRTDLSKEKVFLYPNIIKR